MPIEREREAALAQNVTTDQNIETEIPASIDYVSIRYS
jgi:hypothetical protein